MRWVRSGLLAAALAGAAPLAAQEPPAAATRVHVVQPGETLWELAARFLGDPYRWPEIHRLNRGLVADPNLILPRWELTIPVDAAAPAPAEPVSQEEARSVFFNPERVPTGTRIQISETVSPPVVTSGDFLRAGLLVPEAEVSPVGRLEELVSPSVVPLEIPAQISLYDRVFMTVSAPGAVQVGGRLHLLRPGRTVRPYGRVFEATGVARVIALDGAVATVEVERLYDGVRVGDVAVPLPAFTPQPGVAPRPTLDAVEGHLVAFEEPHPLQGPQDLAFVDLGTESGVEEGDEFVAVLPPRRERWGMRPEIVVARLQVVRTSPRTAAVKVVGVEHPALEPGIPVRLVAKMP